MGIGPAGPSRGVVVSARGEVRFDGGHKRDQFLTEGLGRFVEWVPVCPEVELGLGTPRPSLRLCDSDDGVRLVSPKSGADHTGPEELMLRNRL